MPSLQPRQDNPWVLLFSKDLKHNPLSAKLSNHGHLVSIFTQSLFHLQELQKTKISTGCKLGKNKGRRNNFSLCPGVEFLSRDFQEHWSDENPVTSQGHFSKILLAVGTRGVRKGFLCERGHLISALSSFFSAFTQD